MTKQSYRDEQDRSQLAQAATVLMTEAQQGAGRGEKEAPKSEDRYPLFWRIFGGTILSVVTLLAINVYQSFNASINDLRGSIGRLSEKHAELVHKDEFSSRMTSVWTSIIVSPCMR